MCELLIELGNYDPSKIQLIKSGLENGRFLTHIYPIPNQLNIGSTLAPNADQCNMYWNNIDEIWYKDWYDYVNTMWGTTREVSNILICRYDETQLNFYCKSYKTPPVGALNNLLAEGYTVNAYWIGANSKSYGILSRDSFQLFRTPPTAIKTIFDLE